MEPNHQIKQSNKQIQHKELQYKPYSLFQGKIVIDQNQKNNLKHLLPSKIKKVIQIQLQSNNVLQFIDNYHNQFHSYAQSIPNYQQFLKNQHFIITSYAEYQKNVLNFLSIIKKIQISQIIFKHFRVPKILSSIQNIQFNSLKSLIIIEHYQLNRGPVQSLQLFQRIRLPQLQRLILSIGIRNYFPLRKMDLPSLIQLRFVMDSYSILKNTIDISALPEFNFPNVQVLIFPYSYLNTSMQNLAKVSLSKTKMIDHITIHKNSIKKIFKIMKRFPQYDLLLAEELHLQYL